HCSGALDRNGNQLVVTMNEGSAADCSSFAGEWFLKTVPTPAGSMAGPAAPAKVLTEFPDDKNGTWGTQGKSPEASNAKTRGSKLAFSCASPFDCGDNKASSYSLKKASVSDGILEMQELVPEAPPALVGKRCTGKLERQSGGGTWRIKIACDGDVVVFQTFW